MIFKNHPFYKSLRNITKNKKGSLAIEVMILMITFLLVLCFLVDLLVLSWKFSVISQTNSYVTRTAGLQGGIHYSAPSGFPGGDTAYIGVAEMQNKIQSYFSGAGIEDDEYTVSVNGAIVSAGGQTGEIDYRSPITTVIEVRYKWDLMSNFIPGDFEQTIRSTRSSSSEFKYRYDSWVGE